MFITFKNLKIQNFKNHKDIEIALTDYTQIFGRNGAGKSGIAEAITWLFFGVDSMGASKFDPTPINSNPEDVVHVSVTVDYKKDPGYEPGNVVVFTKELVKGKARYFINEVPKKATEFDKVVAELFDKNLFLSILNPIYFFSQHWKEQREQLLRYVDEPLQKDVLDKLNKNESELLAERIRKNSTEEIQAIYSPKYKQADTAIERAGERYLTLKEQLDNATSALEGRILDDVQKEIDSIQEQLKTAQAVNDEVQNTIHKRSKLENELANLKNKIDLAKEDVQSIMSRTIKEDCDKCGQRLTDEAINKVKEYNAIALAEEKADGREFFEKYKAKLEEYQALSQPGEKVNTASLQEDLYKLMNVIESNKHIERLKEQVKTAEENKETVRKERNHAQSVLEAVKNYETAKAELMAQKVSSLFDGVSIILFETQKNGNTKVTFEVEYKGKPYSKLSTAERIKAGLEVIEALIKQSGVHIPVIIDNAESILNFIMPTAQLITLTVKDMDLTVNHVEV